MKKYNKFGYAGALMLAGLVSFSACSSDDEVVDVNPTFDGKAVKTEFAISLPGAYAKGGRMTATEVQSLPEQFRGLQDIRLYAFKGVNQGLATSASPYSGTKITIAPVADSDALTDKSNSTWANDVELPMDINNFVVYAKATTKADNAVTWFQFGKTNAAFDGNRVDLKNPSDNLTKFTFGPASIATTSTSAQLTAIQTYLKALVEVTHQVGSEGQTKAWKDVSAEEYPRMHELLQQFATGVYGGSAPTMLILCNNLYTKLKDVVSRGGDNDKKMAQAVVTFLENTGNKSPETNIFKKEGESLVYTAESKVSDFPADLNLPDGAAKLKWVNYVPAYDMSASTTLGSSISVYAYPAELYYTVNTPICVANAIKKDRVGGVDWTDFLNTNYNGGAIGVVAADTRSVALKEPLQYAVAQLVTSVGFANAQLPDSEDPNKNIDPSDMRLTAVLVGNQKQVGWDFTRSAVGYKNGLDETSYVVYDKHLNDGLNVSLPTTGSDYSDPNYTLLYETKKIEGAVTADNTDRVNVALEFKNGATEFRGVGGALIPAGSKFYLVGELNLNSNNNKGQSNNLAKDRIFQQDTKTIAKFMISSLASAYNAIPDLRTSEVEFGLSVDLSWRDGGEYDVEIN